MILFRSPSRRSIVYYQITSRRSLSTNNPTEAREAAEKLRLRKFSITQSGVDDNHRKNFLRPFLTSLPSEARFGDPNSPKESLWRHCDWYKSHRPLSHLFPYFHTSQKQEVLAPDGADGLRWPGKPWDLRVWAGGRMQLLESPFLQAENERRELFRVEKVKSVRTTGVPPNDKIYATFRKIIVRQKRVKDSFPDVKALLQAKGESEMPSSAVMVEDQTLCYMRLPNDPSQSQFAKPRPVIPPPVEAPEFSWTMTPTSSLLFFFSAFTLNAHAIHLDPTYARSHYGLKDVIVQGQLTVFLMLEILRSALAGQALRDNSPLQEPVDIEYRNLSPLYVNQPVRICCARLPTTSDKSVPARGMKTTSNSTPRPPQSPAEGSHSFGASPDEQQSKKPPDQLSPPSHDLPSSTSPQEWSVWIQTEPLYRGSRILNLDLDPDLVSNHRKTYPPTLGTFEPTIAVRARVKTRQLDPLGYLSALYRKNIAEESRRARGGAGGDREARAEGP